MTNYQNKKTTQHFNKESSLFQLINCTSKYAIKNSKDNLHLWIVNLEVKGSCGVRETKYPWITVIQEEICIVYFFLRRYEKIVFNLKSRPHQFK